MANGDVLAERDERAGHRRARGERGAGFVEYALLVALITLVCLVAVVTLGQDTSARVEDTASRVRSTTESN